MIKNTIILLLILASTQASHLCSSCVTFTTHLQNSLIHLTPNFIAKDVVQSVCQRQYESTELCNKIADQITPIAIKVGIRGLLKTGRICQLVCPQSFYTKLNLEKQIEKIISGQNAQSFEYISTLPYASQTIKINSGNTKILHMTDIHLDLNYTVNSSINCDFPICCHKEHGLPQSQFNQAPQYGSPKCDTPMKLFDSAINYIQKQIKDLDAIVVTGDFSAHNQWQKTQQTVVKVRQIIQKKIDESLKVELITALGNNQYLPDHQVDPTDYPQQAIKVVDLVNSHGNKMTFISLNTLFCDNINLYLIQDQTMPIRQIKTLDAILAQKDNVFILAHISPTSSSCSQVYAALYRAVLTKHSKKIKAQFFGHTHNDQFVVNTNPQNIDQITNFGLVAGSLSPLGTNQPRFRIYQITNDLQLVNYQDFKFNYQTLNWQSNYRFKEYYGLSFDQPINGHLMRSLQQQMEHDNNLRLKYAAKASSNPASSKFYCNTYDVKQKVSTCSGAGKSFKGNIQDALDLLRGPWGAYGDQIQ